MEPTKNDVPRPFSMPSGKNPSSRSIRAGKLALFSVGEAPPAGATARSASSPTSVTRCRIAGAGVNAPRRDRTRLLRGFGSSWFVVCPPVILGPPCRVDRVDVDCGHAGPASASGGEPYLSAPAALSSCVGPRHIGRMKGRPSGVFVGRARELGELEHALDAARVLRPALPLLAHTRHPCSPG
jgi:hypothetical protein